MKFLTLVLLAIMMNPVIASETVKGAEKDLDSFKQEMSVRLEKIENNLKEMSAKAEKSGNSVYKDAVKDLTQKRDKLRSELYDLKKDSQGGWEAAKSKISSSLNSLNEKIQKALKD